MAGLSDTGLGAENAVPMQTKRYDNEKFSFTWQVSKREEGKGSKEPEISTQMCSSSGNHIENGKKYKGLKHAIIKLARTFRNVATVRFCERINIT